MTTPKRQPPSVVPTLTDIFELPVRGVDASLAVPVPDAATLPASDALVDKIADRVLARVIPELQEHIAHALQAWLRAQAGAGAVVIADALRDEMADHIRAALLDTLGSSRH